MPDALIVILGHATATAEHGTGATRQTKWPLHKQGGLLQQLRPGTGGPDPGARPRSIREALKRAAAIERTQVEGCQAPIASVLMAGLNPVGHMLPNGGRFNEGDNTSSLEQLCREKATLPGPGQYDQRPRHSEMPRGGRFSLGNPKSDVEWMIYFGSRQPGPGEYKIRDPRMIGVDVWGGKFNEARPESDVARKMRIGKCTPGPGDCEIDRDFKTSGGRFNMSNPKTDFDFMLDRAKDMPGPDTYDLSRWPCPAGGKIKRRNATSAEKLDRYRSEGAVKFPKQPVPVRRVRSLNDVSPFRATVTARQSNYVRPAAPQRAANSEASSSTGALVMNMVSDYIQRTKSKVVDVFHFFDKDGNGELDAWELREALAHLGLQLDTEQVVQAMKEIDVNYDGTIDIDEFIKRIRRESIAQRARSRSRAEPLSSSVKVQDQSLDATPPDTIANDDESKSGNRRNSGTPASYAHHLSMARPPLQTSLHAVDWGAAQSNVTNNQRFMHQVERRGEEFALNWDAKTRQLRNATEAARLLELADRRDDALQRLATKQLGRMADENVLGTHFLKVDKSAVVKPTPGEVEMEKAHDVETFVGDRHSPKLDASARFLMPSSPLKGPSHLSPLTMSKSKRQRSWKSNPQDSTRSIISELDAFDSRVGQSREYSITAGPWPRPSQQAGQV